MSEKVSNKMGTAGVVALAMVCTVAYSLWGASVLSAERQAAISGTPSEAVAVGR
ncbi:MAG: hypothetical protein JWL87_29 [Candidatus Adlerbacteria bacterium]|nr:hypothetical protein [Candidatus Adlerbacteria bacterium]